MSHLPVAVVCRPLSVVMLERLLASGHWMTRDALADGASSSPVAIDDALADLVLEKRAQYLRGVGYRAVGADAQRPASGLTNQFEHGRPLMKLYVAGPMSGLPESNYPAFHAAAERLRALGHTVLNPAENPVPPCGGTWQGYMRMALAQLVQCDGIVLLHGWSESKGALIERWLAQVLHMEVMHFSDSAALALVPLVPGFELGGRMGPPKLSAVPDWSAA